ncbi:MAG: adenylate/guanylate cyclase domain-containing protein [Desulfobulbaceae bacterium]|nr:adenylate/guanylate cyclase domain-containing protein [Desulfobulbaceae bacterium]
MTNTLEQAFLQELNELGAPKNVWNLQNKANFRLGRGTDNDVVLPYSWVSRKHTLVQQEKTGIYNIMDLGSSNGTYVNNKRIYSPTVLNNGDLITLGKTTIRFVHFIEQKNHTREAEATLDMTIAYIQKETVTILVCDLHDFTSISETLGNQMVSKLLQFWTKKVGAIIQEHDGLVDKFIGDAVMAVWTGSSVSKGVRNALRAAVEISATTKKIGESVPGLRAGLAIGAAINTGEGMMGNMGMASHRDSTVIGDVVNVAFRLESTTLKDDRDIIIGEETAKYIEEADKFFSKRELTVKGKQEKINAYACTFDQLRYYLKMTA